MGCKTEKQRQEEAQICCNCPYPKCVEEKGKDLRKCDYYDAKMQEIKEKYRKGKKPNEKDRRHIKPTTQAV